ncbi:MAG: hypothetical protein Q8L40_00360, partial [Burkholderiales bacterium]|nr:hypothetical protein [Burkholderiales bacterium]
MSRRLLRFILLAILLVSAGATVAATSPGRAKEDLRQLRDKIEALQKRLADAEESKNEAADALKESEGAISDANRTLRDLGQQSREANRRLAELRTASQNSESTLGAQQTLLARLLYQQYLGGQSEPLKLLLNREDPNQIARQLHYFGYISRARARLIEELRSHLTVIKDL